jgi:hypothetical protein
MNQFIAFASALVSLFIPYYSDYSLLPKRYAGTLVYSHISQFPSLFILWMVLNKSY